MLSDWVRLGSRLVRLLRDQRHADSHEAVLNRLLAQARESVALREQRRAGVPGVTYPEALPITARKQEIVEAIRQRQVVIVAGETGSGKTTQIPKMCLEAGLGVEAKIGCTQPRRVAALSISRRIAEELGVTWGREVGCKIRFDDRAGSETYIKVMTDGILLAEIQGDPLLSEYNAVILDEAHERSLNIDFLLGYLKGLLQKRPELKLIITSATIDTEAFSRAFDHAPVIEVSGRMFPVEVFYAPLDAVSEERGELTYIDAAVQAVERVMSAPGLGDVLIFMPGERDIRETSDCLRSRFGEETEIVPLYGRLTAGDQQRVFAPCSRRKLVVATNIAETSLTIPGIRYVIDSGLARVSRYNPRTRTRRLPIEPIAQSSAEQRKGRSGRVQNGVCLRLYSEEDFAGRPRYTMPEIQRANLAEVILRMKAFRLGEIETFPFINPPLPPAIHGGYTLLQELGALDPNRDLTPLGRDLAHLPIDPTLGRMVLQARGEHATRELLIIAAGLSIQDPRERPLDKKDAAAAAHRRFLDPRSDFLALLNLWNAVHEQWEELRTQNQRRKFCQASFLSYVRMREWQDLHAQLEDALGEIDTLVINESNADYAAIHRSVLAGLLGHVALRQEQNKYRASGNREVTLFPGSVLFARDSGPRRPKSPKGGSAAARGPVQPQWVVAGEMVETSRLFARTLGGIEPDWILDLGAHLCRTTYEHSRWSAAAGRVLIEEITTLYGLEVRRRDVAMGNVQPKEAMEIFIRSALVEEDWDPPARGSDTGTAAEEITRPRGTHSPARYGFLDHNRRVRSKIEIWQTRMRQHGQIDLDEALVGFYSERIQNISSVPELDRFIRDHAQHQRLFATEADLIGTQDLSCDFEAFPDTVMLAGNSAPLAYAYRPGEEEDGVTVTLDFATAQALSSAAVEWAVPGLREGHIAELLRSLPKAIRRQLMPFPPKIAEIMKELRPAGKSLKHDLAEFIRKRYGVAVVPSSWSEAPLPQHVRPRVRITDGNHRVLGAGRDLNELRHKLSQANVEPAGAAPAWTCLAQKWERFGVTGWTFGILPERVEWNEAGHPPLCGWPGLELEQGQVHIRLFRTLEKARQASLAGVQRLIELELQKDLGWLQKDLHALSRSEPLLAGLCSSEELQATAYANLKRYLLPREPFTTLDEALFQAAVDLARERLPGLASQMMQRLELVLKLRADLLRRYVGITAKQTNAAPKGSLSELSHPDTPPAGTKPPMFVAKELAALLPANFLQVIPFEQLAHVPRYLKAVQIRAERAAVNPVKDGERARQVAPYQEALRQTSARPTASPEHAARLEEFRWMIEEFKVSLFAQELGTAFPVSAKRLDQQLERIAGAAG